MNKRILGLISIMIITFGFLFGTAYANNISITNEITSPANKTIWTYNTKGLPNEAAVAINLTNEVQSREPVTVILAIDCSGSMIESDPDRFRVEAAKDFVNLIAEDNVSHKIGVVLWKDFISGVLEPTDDLDAVKKYLDNADASGFTCIYEALNAADLSFKNASTKGKVLILLSDGYDECYSGSDFVAKARDMRSKGISIYTIGLGYSWIEDLRSIGEYSHVSSPDAMPLIFRDFATKVKISLTHVKIEYQLPKNLEPFDIFPAAVYSSTEEGNILTWFIRDMYYKQNKTLTFKTRSKNPGNYTMPTPKNSTITYFVEGIKFYKDGIPQTNLKVKFRQPGNDAEEDDYIQISQPLKVEEASKIFD
jgi:von Willebrand factor type A domain